MKIKNVCAITLVGLSVCFSLMHAMHGQERFVGRNFNWPLQDIVRSALDKYVEEECWVKGRYQADPQKYVDAVVDKIQVSIVECQAYVERDTDLYVLCQSYGLFGLIDFDKNPDGEMRLMVSDDDFFRQNQNRFFEEFAERLYPPSLLVSSRPPKHRLRVIYIAIDLVSLDCLYFDKPGVKPVLTGEILRQMINGYSIGECENPPCIVLFSGGDYADAACVASKSANYLFNAGPEHRKTIGSKITLSLLVDSDEFEPAENCFTCDLVQVESPEKLPELLLKKLAPRWWQLRSICPFNAAQILVEAEKFKCCLNLCQEQEEEQGEE